jgi:hypothetical protein
MVGPRIGPRGGPHFWFSFRESRTNVLILLYHRFCLLVQNYG